VGAPIWVPTATDATGLFARWRAKNTLRRMLDSVLPVVVVDRWRGTEEGSMRGITGQMIPDFIPTGHNAFFFGGLPDPDGVIRVEIEIHRMKAWINPRTSIPANAPRQYNLFTPEAPYNPVEFPAPAGVFIPSLNLDPAFTRGRAGMLAGWNPLPGPLGLMLVLFRDLSTLQAGEPVPIGAARNTTSTSMGPDIDGANQWIVFDPPLRIPAGNGISLQDLTFDTGGDRGMFWTILYHERGIL